MNVRSVSKKQLILDATMALIAEKGLHNTPMSLVSERSAVSTGSIYHYFPSKEALISDLYLDLKREAVAATVQGYNNADPFEQRFFLIWRNCFQYMVSNPARMSFIEQCSTSPLISDEAKTAAERYLEPVTAFIVEGIEAGHLKKLNVQLMISLIYGSIVSTAKLQVAGYLEITEEYRDAAARATWDGIRAG